MITNRVRIYESMYEKFASCLSYILANPDSYIRIYS
jgi:hypothetical protein